LTFLRCWQLLPQNWFASEIAFSGFNFRQVFLRLLCRIVSADLSRLRYVLVDALKAE